MDADIIVVLGGRPEREHFAAWVATQSRYRDVRLLVSSGTYRNKNDFNPDSLLNPYRDRFWGVDFKSLEERLILDRKAIDTVTNFTTTVEIIRSWGCKRALVITSLLHKRRAEMIGRIVYGGSGIGMNVLACPKNYPKKLNIEINKSHQHQSLDARKGKDTAQHSENVCRIVRDCVRALLWLLTGIDGRSIARIVHPNRT
ncbi:hypothetical protein AAMO2058_001731100 [Amorphochlora amoebiformis]